MSPADVRSEASMVMSRHARTFWLAARFLPAAIRGDVIQLYLVCRTLDDLVDGGDPSAATRLDQVAAWAAGAPPVGREETILSGLAERYPSFPLDAVADFCIGQSQDLGAIDFQTEAELDRYAYRVAGTVGRMMAAILGTASPEADAAARALGIALQRTNILRDLDEDARRGRSYLPQESLAIAGGDRTLQIRIELAIANHWYECGLRGISLLRNGSRPVRAAAMMYRAILREVERGLPDTGARAVVSGPRKLRILAGEMLKVG